MQLEQQVVSLELAKKMKELGFKQESYFEWRQYEWGWNVGKTQSMADELDFVSAYTVAELGEMLPESKTYQTSFTKSGVVLFNELPPIVFPQMQNTEADARAKCLIYLVEQGMIKP